MDRGVNMKYALIKNNCIENIIVADYTMANMMAHQMGYIAVNCDNYPVQIGDIYENGAFMNAEPVLDENGNILIPARTVIERNLTAEEELFIVKKENDALKEENQNLQMALAELSILMAGGV